ncbi:glycosyltransferase [Clostridium sp. UBA7503]|uniref:glycosyltransferase n=1 Tax=Clostridium sp. UBA7503 TaxID=1946377 RepID=UPI003217BCF9
MYKIIFMVINMNIGGTEKALLSMIREMDRTKWDITILMLEEYGGFLNEIPGWVNVKYVDEYKSLKSYFIEPHLSALKKNIKNHKYVESIIIAILYLIIKITGNLSYYYRYIFKNIKTLDNNYDIAVAYAGPMDFITYFVANKIKSEKKVQWIHFDIEKIHFNKRLTSKLYKSFDKIFVVSKDGIGKFIKNFPKLKDNTQVFYNILDHQKIKSLADNGESFNDDFHGIRILTVGRLSKEKGQDLTIPVLARLKSEGYKLRWYCVGEGRARSEYEKNINELKIEKDYVLLGSRLNPYPYMKDCDIYVQSSRHEGYCITLAEARCFNNPIITTNFTGANEQIINEENGIIVSEDADSIYLGIKKLLDNNGLYEAIKNNLSSKIINTTAEIEKISRVIMS